MPNPWLHWEGKAFRALGAAALLGGGLVFVVSASPTLRAHLPFHPAVALTFLWLITFALLFSGALAVRWSDVLAWVARSARRGRLVAARPVLAPWPAWVRGLMLAGAAASLAQAVYQAQHYELGWDELSVGALVTSKSVPEIARTVVTQGQFTRTSTQKFVCLATAWLSVKLFGSSEFSLRLPSLLFALGFFVLLYQLCRRYASPLVSVLLFAHLAANQTILYALFSARGYSSLLFFSAFVLYAFLELLEGEVRWARGWRFALYIAGQLGLVINCGNGCLFFVAYFAGACFTLYRLRDELSPTIGAAAVRLLNTVFPMLPVFLVVTALDIRTETGSVKDFAPWGELFQVFGLVLGALKAWVGNLVLALIALVAFARAKERDRAAAVFFDSLVRAAVVFFGAIYALFPVMFRFPRYFVALLVPVALWLGHEITRSRRRPAQLGFALLAGICFLYGPLTSRHILEGIDAPYFTAFEAYMHGLRAEMRRDPGLCVTAETKPFFDVWATFYLPADRYGHTGPGCLRHRHLEWYPTERPGAGVEYFERDGFAVAARTL